MPKKSKPFRVVVEGQTLDGREVTRGDIESMVSSYSLDVYCARINLEHIQGLSPNSDWRTYGKVLSLSSEEIKGGLLDGKLAMLAVVEATDDLLSIHQNGQKLTTSVEYMYKFPATGSPYLVGLAFTDNPASLGTQEMKLSCQNRSVVMSEGVEVNLSIDEPDLLSRLGTKLATLLSRTESSDVQLTLAIDLIEKLTNNALSSGNELKQLTDKYTSLSNQSGEVEALKTTINTLSTELNNIKQILSTTDNAPKRPAATGPVSALITDC